MSLDLSNIPSPLVSVFVMTYNHEQFIAHALDGILMQKANFDFEIIVGEDFSLDNTRKILLDFEGNYPGKFKFLLHEQNIGAIANQIAVHQCCKGKFVALCEGDDYWTDPNKLHKQVNFLEANEDFAICHHNMQVIDQEGRLIRLSNESNQRAVTNITDLAKGNYIYTASCVFRNGLFKNYPEWFRFSPVGDYVLHLLNAQFGKIIYLNEIMGVYRIHQGGIWEHKNVVYRQIQWLTLLFLLEGKFEENVNRILITQKEDIKNSIVQSYEILRTENEITKQELIRVKGSIAYRIGCIIIRPFIRLKRVFRNA